MRRKSPEPFGAAIMLRPFSSHEERSHILGRQTSAFTIMFLLQDKFFIYHSFYLQCERKHLRCH